MNTAERRREILTLLQNADTPIAARTLASRFCVSRQVIVQDLAVIRASTQGILSTTRGYVMQQDVSCTREFKVRHSQEQAAEELTLIVDCGGRVKNISISHRVYGRVSAEMGYPFQTGCGRVCGSPAEQSLHSTQQCYIRISLSSGGSIQ